MVERLNSTNLLGDFNAPIVFADDNACRLSKKWDSAVRLAGMASDDVSVCDGFGRPIRAVPLPNEPIHNGSHVSVAAAYAVVSAGADGKFMDINLTDESVYEFEGACIECDTIVLCADGCMSVRHVVHPRWIRALEFPIAMRLQRLFDRSGCELVIDKIPIPRGRLDPD